jgi:hypothetical protein
MAHMIPLKDEATWTNNLEKIFILNIWSLDELLANIVSDRNRRFHAFWVKICDLLNIRRKMSMAYHPETDRQPERVNQTLKQYHRTL